MKKSSYNRRYHKRRSIRLQNYDYAQSGLYFITLCCQHRSHLFGHIENGKMNLNNFGQIAHDQWKATEKIRPNIKIHEYIIMPNHIHGIIEILYKNKPIDKEIENDKVEDSKVEDSKVEDSKVEDSKGEDSKDEDSKDEDSKGELQFAPTIAPTFRSPSQTIGSIVRGYKIATIKKIKEAIQKGKNKNGNAKDYKDVRKASDGDKKEDTSKLEDSKVEDSKGEDSKGEDSKGELQFAPTVAPTVAPTTVSTIINLNYKIWQRNYYEHIIRNEEAYRKITQYIINNPKKWEEDKLYKKK